MENKHEVESKEPECPETPQLIKFVTTSEVVGFDNVETSTRPVEDHRHDFDIYSLNHIEEEGSETTSIEEEGEPGHHRVHSLSISMPLSPVEAHLRNKKRVFFEAMPASSVSCEQPKPAKFYSQPIGHVNATPALGREGCTKSARQPPGVRRPVDRRFDSFKTWSGKLERQISHLRGKQPREANPEDLVLHNSDVENLTVDRYYAALEGPELDTLRASEQILLPEDKTWPFLLRFPISSFGICLGVTSQAIMWKALAISASTSFLHLSLLINLVLWIISVGLVAAIFSIYLLKITLYFEAVRREYYHPIRVNFFFAPLIALLFLALGVPPSVAKSLPHVLWYLLMAPVFFLELKLYGQWMSGGQRRLSKVANPSNHLAVVGNFVGALLGASMGLKEGPIFFFAVGLAHYMVLFVTLYQRLPTNETLPKELHPVFFLFVAAPSVASMAWATLTGSFGYGSRVAYFIALFLYFSLAVRVNFFRGFKFSLAWWAYTFPMTGAAIATVRYANEVTNVVTQTLAVALSVVATLTVAGLLVTTILHAFVFRDLFPNDIAIAISDRKPKHQRKWFLRKHLSSEPSNIENYLKFTDSDVQDLEASVKPNESTVIEIGHPVDTSSHVR